MSAFSNSTEHHLAAFALSPHRPTFKHDASGSGINYNWDINNVLYQGTQLVSAAREVELDNEMSAFRGRHAQLMAVRTQVTRAVNVAMSSSRPTTAADFSRYRNESHLVKALGAQQQSPAGSGKRKPPPTPRHIVLEVQEKAAASAAAAAAAAAGGTIKSPAVLPPTVMRAHTATPSSGTRASGTDGSRARGIAAADGLRVQAGEEATVSSEEDELTATTVLDVSDIERRFQEHQRQQQELASSAPSPRSRLQRRQQQQEQQLKQEKKQQRQQQQQRQRQQQQPRNGGGASVRLSPAKASKESARMRGFRGYPYGSHGTVLLPDPSAKMTAPATGGMRRPHTARERLDVTATLRAAAAATQPGSNDITTGTSSSSSSSSRRSRRPRPWGAGFQQQPPAHPVPPPPIAASPPNTPSKRPRSRLSVAMEDRRIAATGGRGSDGRVSPRRKGIAPSLVVPKTCPPVMRWTARG